MIRKHLNPADAAGLGATVEAIAAGGVPPQAVEIYQGRNVVAAFDGPDGRRLNIKAFRRPNALNRLVYGMLRRGKARRAYENALRLLAAGIVTPRPLAWIECRTCAGMILTDSYFLSEQLDGWEDIRRISGHPDFDIMARDIAALMLRLHRAGIWMKDFTPGNVLWHRRADGAGYEYALVDINRMAFGVTSRRRLMSNFGRLFPGDDDAVDKVAGYYAAACGYATGSAAEAAVRDSAAGAIADAQRRIRRKNRMKKILKR